MLLKGGGQERPTTAEWDPFTDALDRLQPVHLDLLATVVTHNLVALRQKDAWKRLPELRPDVTPAVRLRCWEDLAAVGVLQPFAVLTADDDESGLEDTGQVITVFGVQFVAFLDLDQVRAEESRS